MPRIKKVNDRLEEAIQITKPNTILNSDIDN